MSETPEQRIERLAAELQRLRSAGEILRFRRRLDAATARAVIRRLPAVDRAAVLLAVAFAPQGKTALFDAVIGELNAEDAKAVLQDAAAAVPSAAAPRADRGQPRRDERRTAARRAR